MLSQQRFIPQQLFRALTAGLLATLLTSVSFGQTSLVQIIHASPFVEADTFDVYIADTLAIDNFAFMMATPMMEMPARVPIDVAIAPKDAAGAEEAIWQKDLTLDADSVFWLMAAGDPLEREGYPTFNVFVSAESQSDGPDANESFVIDAHAIPDVALINIKNGGTTYTSNLPFGERGPWNTPGLGFESIITLQTDDNQSLNTYLVDIVANELGKALVAVHSGFRNPPSPDASGLVYFAVFEDGSVKMEPEARTKVSFVNASPYPESEYVSLWISNVMFADSVAFRTGTATVPWFSGLQPFTVRTPGGVEPSKIWHSRLTTLAVDDEVLLVAAGDPQQREEHPPMRLYQKNISGGLSPTGGLAGVFAFNAAWDSPPLDFARSNAINEPFITDLAYGNFNSEPALIQHGVYTIHLRSGDRTLAELEADLSAPWPTVKALSVTTGFFNPPGDTLPTLDNRWIFSDGTVWEFPTTVDAEDSHLQVPVSFALRGNYPNPFNPTTKLVFDLPATAEVGIDVFDVAGRMVLQVAPQRVPAGAGRTLEMDASILSSGIYFYRIVTPGIGETLDVGGKMILMK